MARQLSNACTLVTGRLEDIRPVQVGLILKAQCQVLQNVILCIKFSKLSLYTFSSLLLLCSKRGGEGGGPLA